MAVRTHAVNFGWPDCRFRICGHQCFPEKLLGSRFCGGESIRCDQECGGKITRFVAATSKLWECCLPFAPLTNYDWTNLYCTWFQLCQSDSFTWLSCLMSQECSCSQHWQQLAEKCVRGRANKKWYNQKLEPSRTNSRQLLVLSCVLSFTSEVHVLPLVKMA